MSARDDLAARVAPAPVATTPDASPDASPDGSDLDALLAGSINAQDAIRAAIAKRDANKPFAPVASPSGLTAWYQVVQGDTLASIATKLSLASPYHDLYQPNIGAVGSYTEYDLTPGTWLEYRPSRERAAPNWW